MAGEPHPNYVGPPDFDESGRCGFAVDLTAPRWLDLCAACTCWLRTNLTADPLYPPTP